MYIWVVQYRKTKFHEFYISSEAFWSMDKAEEFIKGRANSPKPAHGYEGIPCYQYISETGEEYIITEVHLTGTKEA